MRVPSLPCARGVRSKSKEDLALRVNSENFQERLVFDAGYSPAAQAEPCPLSVNVESCTIPAIVLPSNIGVGNLSGLFLVASSIAACAEDITLDASRVNFVDPLGMAVLAAMLEPRNDRRIAAPWLATSIAAYLKRMDFFARCDLEGVYLPERNRHDRKGVLVELTKIDDERDVSSAAARLANALTGKITAPDPYHPADAERIPEFDSYNYPIQYSLSELLQNSLSHARRNGRHDAAVWVAAQYFPSKQIVRLAVVDNGCGMLATLRSHAAVQGGSHLQAILAALQPRVSCNRDLVAYEADTINEGVGLTTTYRIAEAAEGGLIIVSGDGAHDTAGESVTFDNGAFWDGVAICLTCKRDALPHVNVGDLLPPIDAPEVNVRFL